MTNEQTKDDSNGGHKYFGTIPHIAGAELDVYEHRLYCHYIEICGVSKTDECYQAEKTIYIDCDMSKQRFLKARQGLIGKKFITFRPGKPNKKGQKGYSALTTIIDIWAENIKFCQRRSYTGHILPVEGVNNYPLKGSDITPSKNIEELKRKKDSAAKNAAHETDGDTSIMDDSNDDSGGEPIQLTAEQAKALEEINERAIADGGINTRQAHMEILIKLGYVYSRNSGDGKFWWQITDKGRSALEAYRERCDSQPEDCSDTEQSGCHAGAIQAQSSTPGKKLDTPLIDQAGKMLAVKDGMEKKRKRKPRKKKAVHLLYHEMHAAIIEAFGVNTEHLDKGDFSRIGKETNALLDKGAKPFMIKHLYRWLDNKFDTFGYNVLAKWYAQFRAESSIPDEQPEKNQPKEPIETEPGNADCTHADAMEALRIATEKMDMSQFDDENYEDDNDGRDTTEI